MNRWVSDDERDARNDEWKRVLKSLSPTETEKRAVYRELTDNGPDVDTQSGAFRLLVETMKKDGVNLEDGLEIYEYLVYEGYFGPKADLLRATSDRYF